MKNDLYYYWLSLAKISTLKLNKLLEIYSVEELYDQIKEEERIAALIGDEQYKLLLKYRNQDFLYQGLDEIAKNGVKIITRSSSSFPNKLMQAEVNAPIMLYYVGDEGLLNSLCISIVGTRHCSRYGKEMAEKFASELAAYDFTIVSGLAMGIDAYAHEAVISCGGKAIAVLGMGHNKFSPVSNRRLFDKIAQSGLIISEYPPNMEGAKYTFPQRNRLISGLSDVVIIVEAANGSGALITAEMALEQNREVYAIPGNINSSKSSGTNALIKSGASVLTETGDILKYFTVKNTKLNKKLDTIQLDIYEQKIYNLLEKDALNFDAIMEDCGFSASELAGILLSMEMKDIIIREHGNEYRIKK